VGAGKFLKDFQPIADFAANSGPYGSLAVGTLSALFAIAQSKSKAEDDIRTALEDVRDRLPGLEMLGAIYYEKNLYQDRLRTRILLARSGVIELAITSAEYYLRSGARRWWLAVSDPKAFEMLANKVQKYVMDIREQGEQVLAQRVLEIRTLGEQQDQKISMLLSQNKSLQEGNNRLQAENDRLKLDSIREILELSSWSPEIQSERLLEYRDSLNRVGLSSHKVQWLDSDKVVAYRKERLCEWESSPASSMLLIVGRNHHSLVQRFHCWMSPLAVELILSLQLDAKPLAYYTFDIGDEGRTPVHKVMADIMLQLITVLIEAQPDESHAGLFPLLHIYRTELELREKHGGERAEKALVRAASAIIKSFHARHRLYIVLDRIDWCTSQTTLLRVLVKMTEDASCSVKVLLVAHAARWDVMIEDDRELMNCERLKSIEEKQDLRRR